MPQHRSPAPPPAPPRRGLARRIRRGVIAGYVHEISQRHHPAPATAPPLAAPAPCAACG